MPPSILSHCQNLYTCIYVQSFIELPSFLLRIVANSEYPNLTSFLYNVNTRGIKSDFTATDIKKAYRKAALKHHPDKV